MSRRKSEESQALREKAEKMFNIIPLDQHILVNQYGEKIDRRSRARIQRAEETTFELQKKLMITMQERTDYAERELRKLTKKSANLWKFALKKKTQQKQLKNVVPCAI